MKAPTALRSTPSMPRVRAAYGFWITWKPDCQPP
jgi:hypothetical protein